jgi:hypothetical protein
MKTYVHDDVPESWIAEATPTKREIGVQVALL